jgi:Tfp pilus assembly protein PilO
MAFDWQTEYHRYRRYFVDLGQLYKKRKKVRVYTGIILSLLTVSFFLFFAIKPTLTTIAGLIKAIKDQRVVVDRLQTKINALSLAQSEYNLIQNDIFLVDEALPTDSQVSTLTKQLEVLARREGVTVETIKFGQVYLKGEGPKTEEKPKNDTSSVNFSFAASGEYQNLKSFLRSLSSLRRIILVDSFAFKTGKTEGERLTLSLNAQAFFLKED